MTGLALAPEGGSGDPEATPMAQLEAQKVGGCSLVFVHAMLCSRACVARQARHEAKMQKMEQEMSLVFAAKVREKEEKLKASEEKLLSQHDAMQRDLQAERACVGGEG